MDTCMETAVFFEKAENTLHDIAQEVRHGSDVQPRQYMSVLKDWLTRIKELKVMITAFRDAHYMLIE